MRRSDGATERRLKIEALQGTKKHGFFIRFKDENGKDYPDWVEKTLGEICSKIGDGIHSTPKYDDEGNYYFINGNNLIDGKIVFSQATKRISEDEYNSYKNELNQFSLLMSINGTIGSLAFYNNEQILLGKSACYLNPLENVADRNFVYYLLSSDKIQNHFFSSLTGTTIKNLSLASIRKTRVLIPPLKEQKKIASFLTEIDEKIDQSSNQIQNTRQYKQALLQQLFN